MVIESETVQRDLIRFRERSEQELSTGEADLQPAGLPPIYSEAIYRHFVPIYSAASCSAASSKLALCACLLG